MKKISSSSTTFISKKLYPLMWFGPMAFIILRMLTRAAKMDPIFLLLLLLIAVAGFFLMKKFYWGSADEVYDCGDFLLIRKGGEEERVALSNIMNVSMSAYARIPNPIRLRLVNPGKFGKEISFFPVEKFTLNLFAKNQVTEDLIVRVDQARSKRAI